MYLTYVLNELVTRGYLTHNPMTGLSLDATKVKHRRRHPVTRDEWNRLINYLLEVVTAPELTVMPGKEDVPQAHKHASKLAHLRVAQYTLLLAGLGARSNEALELRWTDMTEDTDGTVWLLIDETKTGKSRTVPILVPKIAAYFCGLKPKDPTRHSEYIIGGPLDPAKTWHRTTANKVVREYYPALAEFLDIPALKTERAHIWRKTLNTILKGSALDSMRAAYFGHTEKENVESYTDTVNVRPMRDAMQAVLAELNGS